MPSEVEKVAGLLLAAKNPIVVAEQSGRDPAAFKALVELADLLAIPVTWGRVANFANFPTDHPLYLGVASYEHLKDADLILLVGGRAPWYPPHTRPTKGKIVAINENQFKGHMIYQQPARRRLSRRRHRRVAAGADASPRAQRSSTPTP